MHHMLEKEHHENIIKQKHCGKWCRQLPKVSPKGTLFWAWGRLFHVIWRLDASPAAPLQPESSQIHKGLPESPKISSGTCKTHEKRTLQEHASGRPHSPQCTQQVARMSWKLPSTALFLLSGSSGLPRTARNVPDNSCLLLLSRTPKTRGGDESP